MNNNKIKQVKYDLKNQQNNEYEKVVVFYWTYL